jgi:hypothetical protein
LALGLEKHYLSYFSRLSKELTDLYDSITLDNYYNQSADISNFATVYPANEDFATFKDGFYAVHITDDDKTAIKKEIVPGIMKSCIERYANDIAEIKDDLLLKLPARKKELEQIEELRKSNDEAAAKAEAEAKERAEEEERKRKEEQAKKEGEVNLKAEAAAHQANIFNSFGETAAAIPTTVPKAKVEKKIRVSNAKGFLEVYQLWFVHEGSKLSLEELEKAHKKFITFAEKRANKEGETIASPFVEYIDDVKAK